MGNIWSFLLQTLTASGVAVLLLAVKTLFRDKLPPRWQFAIWGILGVILLIPAGIGGRYVLFNWPLWVEALRTLLTGEYAFTRVQLPFPVLKFSAPASVFDWLYLVYFAGVLFHLAKYLLAYIRLRLVLRHGKTADTETMERIQAIALAHKVKVCRGSIVPGLPSAFVCGVFRPVLALPDDEVDDKILLHELLHLKSRDTVWSIVICILRSIHWCNPLLVYCAKQAGNDLEARCDQRVLELLEGEDRRDYGKILLSMSNDRFARTPGATCANNGGKNIRLRIESIARFKLYPRGMGLVAVCTAIILALPLIIGVNATSVYQLQDTFSPAISFASARTATCTTPAGAFDAYGKAILDQNGVYRAMCAPASMQKELAELVTFRYENSRYPYWDTGLNSWPSSQEGYYLYNLRQVGDGYEAMLVFQLNYRPDGQAHEFGRIIVACQNIRAEKENDRWVVIPLEDFWWQEHTQQQISWGAAELPGYTYSAWYENIRVDINVQTIHYVDNTVTTEDDMSFLFGSTTSYDMVPKPNAEFDWVRYTNHNMVTHLGTQEERDQIHNLRLSIAELYKNTQRPELETPPDSEGVSSSNQGTSWTGVNPQKGWGPVLHLNGGGSSGPADVINAQLPYGYAVDLYINGEKKAELDLTLQEGGSQ